MTDTLRRIKNTTTASVTRLSSSAQSFLASPNTPTSTSSFPSNGFSASTSTDEILKQGVLRKQGGEFKSWKERWFVLTKDSLSYYKKKEDTTPIKTVPLGEMTDCRPESASWVLEARRFPYLFVVETGLRTFLISARSEVERKEWVDTIAALIKMNNSSAAAAASGHTGSSPEPKKELDASKTGSVHADTSFVASGETDAGPVPWIKKARGSMSAAVSSQRIRKEFDNTLYTRQLKVLVRNEALSDLVLQVGIDLVPVHRAILAARCPVMLRFIPPDSNVHKPAVSLDGFVSSIDSLNRVLDYVYLDEIELTVSTVMDVLYTANTFELIRLQQICKVFIRNRLDVGSALVLLKGANRQHLIEEEHFVLRFLKNMDHYKVVLQQPEAQQMVEENNPLYVTLTQVLGTPDDQLASELINVTVLPSTHKADIEGLMQSHSFADLHVFTKDGIIFAHRIIVQARCPLFMDEGTLAVDDSLRNSPIGKPQTLKFPTLCAETVFTFLQYLYSNSIVLDSLVEAYNLIELAERVSQDNLFSLCEEMMRQFLNKDTALKILMVASEYELVNLKKEALALIIKHAPEILKRPELRQVLSQWPWNLIDIIRALASQDASRLSDEEDYYEDNDQGHESDDDKIPVTPTK